VKVPLDVVIVWLFGASVDEGRDEVGFRASVDEGRDEVGFGASVDEGRDEVGYSSWGKTKNEEQAKAMSNNKSGTQEARLGSDREGLSLEESIGWGCEETGFDDSVFVVLGATPCCGSAINCLGSLGLDIGRGGFKTVGTFGDRSSSSNDWRAVSLSGLIFRTRSKQSTECSRFSTTSANNSHAASFRVSCLITSPKIAWA
jgi:hypothetical protein